VIPLSKLDDWLVAEWRRAWAWAAMWVYGLIAIAPDLYNGVTAMGWLSDGNVPPAFVWTLRGLAVVGMAARLYRQRKPEPKP
jgi:hypothetical protein